VFYHGYLALGVYLLWAASAESRRRVGGTGFGGSTGVRELGTLKSFGCYFQCNFNMSLLLRFSCRCQLSIRMGGGTGLNGDFFRVLLYLKAQRLGRTVEC
jgi:hypothetical protein